MTVLPSIMRHTSKDKQTEILTLLSKHADVSLHDQDKWNPAIIKAQD